MKLIVNSHALPAAWSPWSCRWLLAVWLWHAAQLTAAQSVSAGPTTQRPQPVQDFSQLMAAFSRMPGLEARFVEEKHIALLALPIESRGRIFFARPGLFLRRVESPSPSDIVITASELRVRDDAGDKRIDLDARPEIRPFIQSLLWLMSGAQRPLSDVYNIAFQPEQHGAPWQLTLTPKAEPISRLIAHMRVSGVGLRVDEIRVRELRGDESITRISDADPARSFSAEEQRSLFGVPTPTAPSPKAPAGSSER
jgi:outer membrane lipoprotein-sorting protein